MEPSTGPTDSPTIDIGTGYHQVLETCQEALFDPPSGDEAHEENAVTQEEPDLTTRHQCCFCQRRVDPSDPDTHEEITSWVHGKKKDSAVLRSRSGRLACRDCISKMRAGLAIDQPDYETLLAEDPKTAYVDGIFSDRHVSYDLGYRQGLDGESTLSPVELEKLEANLDEYYEGHSDGEEARIAKDRLGTPLSEQD